MTRNQTNHSSLIMPMIALITDHFSNSVKFHGNVKILQQRAHSARNSVAHRKLWALLISAIPLPSHSIALMWLTHGHWTDRNWFQH